MSLTRTVALTAFFVCGQLPLAHANTITLNGFDSGELSFQWGTNPVFCGSGPDSFSHDTGLGEVGAELVSPCGFGAAIFEHTQGYLIFDLAPLTSTVTAAALSFTIESLTGVDGTMQIYDYTVTSAADLADLPAGMLPNAFGENLKNDFSSGNLLGSEQFTAASTAGVYDLDLSTYALAQINDSSGLFAMAVNYVPSLSGDILFENISIAGPGQLKLETGVPVPAPATLPLLAVGLAGLAWIRRKRA